MNLNDTVRLRQPLSPAEGRVATIVGIEPRPTGTYGDSYRLRFPNGDESNFYATEIRSHNREADRRAIITALTAATNSLRKACLIAHDYDEEVSAEILFAYSQIVGTGRTRLNIDLHPPRSHDKADTGPDGGPR